MNSQANINQSIMRQREMDKISAIDDKNTAVGTLTKYCNNYVDWLHNQKTCIIRYIQILYQQELSYINKLDEIFRTRLQTLQTQYQQHKQDEKDRVNWINTDLILGIMLCDVGTTVQQQSVDTNIASVENTLNYVYNCIANKKQCYQTKNIYPVHLDAYTARISEIENIISNISKIRNDILMEFQQRIIQIGIMYQEYEKSIRLICLQSSKWIDFQQAKKLLVLKKIELIRIFENSNAKCFLTSKNPSRINQNCIIKTETYPQGERSSPTATEEMKTNILIISESNIIYMNGIGVFPKSNTSSNNNGTNKKQLIQDRQKTKNSEQIPNIKYEPEIETTRITKANGQQAMAVWCVGSAYQQHNKSIAKDSGDINNDTTNNTNVNVLGLNWYNDTSDNNNCMTHTDSNGNSNSNRININDIPQSSSLQMIKDPATSKTTNATNLMCHNRDIQRTHTKDGRKPNDFMSMYKQFLFTKDLSHKWQCIKCNRIITTRSGLVSHYNKHIGIKKFNCQYCNRKFGNRTSLVRHERIHTGSRPFKCHICQKAFTQKYQRKLHIQNIHHKIKAYSCNICQKLYTQSSSLRRHQKKSHHMYWKNIVKQQNFDMSLHQSS